MEAIQDVRSSIETQTFAQVTAARLQAESGNCTTVHNGAGGNTCALCESCCHTGNNNAQPYAHMRDWELTVTFEPVPNAPSGAAGATAVRLNSDSLKLIGLCCTPVAHVPFQSRPKLEYEKAYCP